MKFIGTHHRAILNELATDWWDNGPPVAIMEGFPGVGKTQLAEELVREVGRVAGATVFPFVQCPSRGVGIVDDLLLEMASSFAEAGDDRLANSPDLNTLHQLLADPVLVVIDEFQNGFEESPARPSKLLANWISRISGSRHLRGRILCLTSREVERDRWSERCLIRTLHGLSTEDGVELLSLMLKSEGLEDACLPLERRPDVANWLGGFPRAMRLLVSLLRHEVLEDLLGIEPEAWEARDRDVSRVLIQKVEYQMVTRARVGLPAAAETLLRKLVL